MYEPFKRTVYVWSKPYEITIFQKSKTVWIAAGQYMGAHVEVKGTTATAAEKHWREAAMYKGNDGIQQTGPTA